MSILENHESITAQGGGGYPPGGYGPPGGGGYPPGGGGPPGGPPGGWGPPGGGPPGGGPPGGWGPPGGGPPGGGPPGGPPGGWGPPGGGPPGGGGPGGYGPPGGGPPGGGPPGGYGPPGGAPPGGYGPPGGGPPGGYGPPGGAPPGGGYGAPPGPGGYGPPGGAPPYGGGFAPPPYQPGAPPIGGGGPGFEATEAIGFGWNAVMKNFGGVAVPLAVAGLVSAIPNFVLSFGRAFAFTLLTSSGSLDPMVLMILNFGSIGVTYLISLVAQAYMVAGMVQFALRVARGERPEFGVVFGGGPYFVAMLGGTLLYSLGVSFGFALCIVPGLFLAGCWVAYSAFIVDKGMGPIAALSASWQATTPYRTNALVYILLSGVVVIAGALACGIGALLVSLPVLMVGNAYVYLKLIGEQPRIAA